MFVRWACVFLFCAVTLHLIPRKVKIVMKNVVVMLVFCFAFLGCASLFQFGQTKVIMAIEDVNSEGDYASVKLKKDKQPWSLCIGNQFKDEYLGYEPVSVKVSNRSSSPIRLGFYSHNWCVEPGESECVFSGLLSDFWKQYSVVLSKGRGDYDWDPSFDVGVELKFENANIELKRPLVVTASWSDSL